MPKETAVRKSAITAACGTDIIVPPKMTTPITAQVKISSCCFPQSLGSDTGTLGGFFPFGWENELRSSLSVKAPRRFGRAFRTRKPTPSGGRVRPGAVRNKRQVAHSLRIGARTFRVRFWTASPSAPSHGISSRRFPTVESAWNPDAVRPGSAIGIRRFGRICSQTFLQ